MNWLRRMMYGRYGGLDALNGFLFGIAVLCMIVQFILQLVYRFTGNVAQTVTTGVNVLALVLLIIRLIEFAAILLFFLRTMSRNIPKRQAENQKFLKLFHPVKDRFDFMRKRSAEKKAGYALFRCPRCKKSVRVPMGRGRIEITCPACKNKFIKKS